MGKIGRNLTKLLAKHSGKVTPKYDFNRQESSVESVLINEICPNSEQPRQEFNDEKLQELSISIKEKGVLQPVIYRITPKGKELIAGERRWRAARIAGLKSIPAILMNVTDEEALEVAMIENIQRDDLNPIEKGKGFKELIAKYDMTQQEISDRLGVNRTTIANLIRLLQLPDKVKDHVSRETISMGHARCLLAVKDEKEQVKLADRIASEGLSVRTLEQMVYGTDEPEKTPNNEKNREKDPNITALEVKFKQALGTKVTIKSNSKKKGKIIIEFYGNEDFIRIAEIFGINL